MTSVVVIPAYNGLAYLQANLPAVLALNTNEVIVVDDASTDGTSEFIRQTYPHIHLITNASNQRFPKSVNIGFAATTADVVFLINQDVQPDRDLVRRTLPYFKKRSRLFALSFNEGKFGWAKVSFRDGFINYSSAVSPSAHTSFWASGGSCAVRKSIWDQLGGFDPVFTPGYHEDLDIGWRARKRGYEILWVPEARVEHEREATFPKTFPPPYLQRIKDRNYLLCQWKNLDTPNLWIHLVAVFGRCLRHPGFLVPVAMAKWHWPHILAYRARNTRGLLSDVAVFRYGSQN
jgi:GT2 family glycosyltransferase